MEFSGKKPNLIGPVMKTTINKVVKTNNNMSTVSDKISSYISDFYNKYISDNKLVIIVIILFILFLIYRYQNKKKNTHEQEEFANQDYTLIKDINHQTDHLILNEQPSFNPTQLLEGQ